jgi:UDPglucose--hexose-1-phosphate uridylyltransferase
MLREARAHAERTGGNLFTDILANEVADGSRIIARTELFTAFVPFAARWPGRGAHLPEPVRAQPR